MVTTLTIAAVTAITFGFMATTAAIICLAAYRALGRRVRELERALLHLQSSMVLTQPVPLLPPTSSPLEGLRIAIAIRQDHPHPVFAGLLREQLLKDDVAEVVVLEPGQSAAGTDILVQGELVGNGYAEVYYRAELTATAGNETICNLVEKPPDGDRPGNLAMEFVALLRGRLEDLISRNERRRALRELGFG